MLQRVSFETDLAEACRRHNVSLLAYSPLAGEWTAFFASCGSCLGVLWDMSARNQQTCLLCHKCLCLCTWCVKL
jgi:diketogulonate reductase-like aldo/keto reductase